MGNAWFVRPVLDGTNMMDWFKSHNIIATKVKGTHMDIDDHSSVDLTGKNVSEIQDILSQQPYQLKGSELGNSRLSLDLFVNQMKKGDLVLVPYDQIVHFARIEGDYKHQSHLLHPIYSNTTDRQKPPWLAHQRNVTWLGDVSRKDLSSELRVALKNQRLVGDLTKFYDEMEARSQGLQYEPVRTTIDVQFPLRPDFEIRYTVPADMTAAEAKRLSAHFKTIFFRESCCEDTEENS